MKRISFEIKDIESGASTIAAEVLLIGLRHIREHRKSYPIGVVEDYWFDKIVPELIWLCEFVTEKDGRMGHLDDEETQRRYHHAKELLGRHFTDIWC